MEVVHYYLKANSNSKNTINLKTTLKITKQFDS